MNNTSLLRFRSALAALLAIIFSAAGVLTPAFCAYAADGAEDAQEIKCAFSWNNVNNAKNASDGDHSTFATCKAGAAVTLESEKEIGFLYVEFNHAPGKWTASAADVISEHGQNGFIHEYADVRENFGVTNALTLSFAAGTEITDIRVFGAGRVPDRVQRWEPPAEKADILLIPAHSDDDQLYFAGLLPYYCTVRRLTVQTVFFTEHLNENYRWHERLDALWTSGVRNYPLVSEFPDQYSRDLNTAFSNFSKKGYSRQAIEEWLALQLRRFRPLVAVTHALDGEYGHGQHMAAAQTLTSAADLAADPSFVTEGYAEYDLPKLYLHSDSRGQILIDCYDTSFEELGGSTPFNVSQKAYLVHKSQYYSDLLKWMFGTVYPVSKPGTITITRADQITKYNPRVFGLVRRGAGMPEDEKKNDFMENLLSYAEQAESTAQTEELTEPVTSPQETEPETTALETEPALTDQETKARQTSETEPADSDPLETDSGTGFETGTETGSGTGAESDSETGLGTDSENGSKTGSSDESQTLPSPETSSSPSGSEAEPPKQISPATAVLVAAAAVIVTAAIVAAILIFRKKQ